MRDIVFRGKRVDNGEWVYGGYVKDYRNNSHLIFVNEVGAYNVGFKPRREDYSISCYEVDPNTIGQYTGLKDKNGKMIFEGDLVSINHDNFSNDIDNPQPYVKWVGEVKRHETGYSVFQNNDSYKPSLSNIRIIDIEIIGNIHEVQND